MSPTCTLACQRKHSTTAADWRRPSSFNPSALLQRFYYLEILDLSSAEDVNDSRLSDLVPRQAPATASPSNLDRIGHPRRSIFSPDYSSGEASLPGTFQGFCTDSSPAAVSSSLLESYRLASRPKASRQRPTQLPNLKEVSLNLCNGETPLWI